MIIFSSSHAEADENSAFLKPDMVGLLNLNSPNLGPHCESLRPNHQTTREFPKKIFKCKNMSLLLLVFFKSYFLNKNVNNGKYVYFVGLITYLFGCATS